MQNNFMQRNDMNHKKKACSNCKAGVYIWPR
jgi:hypothetical protein